MKKKFLLIVFIGFLNSCQQKITSADLINLNGYWEIVKAVTADGTKKEYKVNETIDYFDIKNKKGFRKKVMPQLNGTYLVNNQQESIEVEAKEGKTFLNYTTTYAKWKEQIISLTKDKLVLKNEQNHTYFYKKPIPFSVK